ncbi:MAG: hypothetical protein AAF518_19695 [Spirochaetota bacterium]
MKQLVKIVSLVFLSGFITNCPQESDNDNERNLSLLYLASQNSSNADSSISSQYSNSVSGSSTDVAASTSTASASTSASSSAGTSASTSVSTSIKKYLNQIRTKVASKAIRAQTCDGTTKSYSGTYTTSFTVNGSSTSSIITSGSYTVTPNLKINGSYSCPTGGLPAAGTLVDGTYDITSSYTYTGSIEIIFNDAKIKYFDIESHVNNGTYSLKESTLNGTITTSDINDTIENTASYTYTSSPYTVTVTSTLNGSGSSKVSSSSLQADSGSATSIDATTSQATKWNTSYTTSVPNGVSSTCYNSVLLETGYSVTGTYNGNSVTASYYLDTDKYEELLKEYGVTFTDCTVTSALK